MRGRLALALLASLIASAVGCGDRRAAPEPESTSVAHFDPGGGQEAGPLDWGAVPFPNEIYRDVSGRLVLGALPSPRTDSPLLGAIRDTVGRRNGFCATCNVYFGIDGAIDPSSVLVLGSGATLEAGEVPVRETAGTRADPLLLIDADPESPERGRIIPLRVEWLGHLSLIALRPVRGIALAEGRRYVAALTSRVRGVDGLRLAPSPVFRRLRDARSSGDAGGDDDDPPVSERLGRARQLVAEGLQELERAGIESESVASLAVFRTETVTQDLRQTRLAVQGAPPAVAVVDRVRVGEEIDDLLGLPSESRPGIEVPPIAGTAGSRSIVHEHLSAVISGHFDAPRLVEGSGLEIGFARRDASGAIVAGPLQPVPFLLTLPKRTGSSRLPVVIEHHGFNASRVTGLAVAETAARAGVAVLAIDAFQHGDRAASARDEVNAIRGGTPGSDGFAETNQLEVSGRVFGVIGAEPGLEGFAGYAHATFLQFAADVISAVRLAAAGDWSALAAAELPGGWPGFDPARIGFVGNSLGAVVGVEVLAVEPTLRAGVLNVQPGSIVETLAESPEFRPLTEAVFLPLLGIDPKVYDEVDRHLIFDPIVDLSRWILEPIDPLALAQYLTIRPIVEGERARILLQTAAQDEVAAPFATESMVAAAGAIAAGEGSSGGAAEARAPRLTRYGPAAHGMLEVLEQSSRLEPPILPPFRPRPAPLAIRNPIEAVHAEIEAFLAATLGDGQPRQRSAAR